MRKFTKFMALVLVVLMLAPALIACGGDGKDPSATTTVATTVNTSGSGSTEKTWEPLPAMNWEDAEFTVAGIEGDANPQFTNMEIYAEELKSEIVNDTVFARNEALKTMYHFVVKQDLLSRTNDADEAQITNMMNTGEEDRWGLIIQNVPFMQKMAQQGFLVDLNTVNYINFDAPCWNEYANEQLTVVNKLFYTISDFLLMDKHRLYLNIYNREMARAYEFGYIEDLVDSGEWTIEKALEFSRTVSIEVDGLSGHTSADAFGVVMDSTNALAAFAFGFETRASKIDADGKIVLSGLDNNAADKWVKVGEYAMDPAISLYCTAQTGWGIANEIFCDERALITTCFLSSFDTTLSANMDFEYGFLPNPKYTADQENYYTIPDIVGSVVLGVPYTALNKDFSGFCTQALSELSTTTTLPAYYETKCKLSLSYDQRCSDMLDLIFDGITYDVVYISNLGNLKSDVYGAIASYNASAWTRLYNKKAEAAQIALDEIITAYQEMQ